ncbi:hypothetical protein KFE25_011882 [Diacronema lutheri]|uniref:Uncharacterized protein n=1 Tax=Diacronema lutheri TaxID=2081491 RepID=A0A8J5X427_DIALT|nr:hypothetical protein KFE25_011882 [Diacronema lutheri]
MRKSTLWVSTFKEECGKLLIEPNRRVLDCVELNDDADVAIRVVGRKDGPPMHAIDVTALALTLRAYPLVHSVTLAHQSLGDGALDALHELISHDSTIVMLDFRYDDIGGAGCAKLCSALAHNETVQVLDLSGNPVGFEGGFCAAEMLQTNTALASLALDDTEIETEAVVALATALRENSTLTALSLSNPRLSSLADETAVHFAGALRVNASLTSLDLSKHGMREHGLQQIVTALLAPRDDVPPSALRTLSLRCNPLGEACAPLLAALVAQLGGLEMLNVSGCALKDATAIAISRALAHRSSATSIDLSSNGICAPGLVALADALTSGAPVLAISLWGNMIDGRAAAALGGALRASACEADFVVDQPEVGRFAAARAN